MSALDKLNALIEAKTKGAAPQVAPQSRGPMVLPQNTTTQKSGMVVPPEEMAQVLEFVNQSAKDTPSKYGMTEPLRGLKHISKDVLDTKDMREALKRALHGKRDSSQFQEFANIMAGKKDPSVERSTPSTEDTAKMLMGIQKMVNEGNVNFTSAQLNLLNQMIGSPNYIQTSGMKAVVPGAGGGAGGKQPPVAAIKEYEDLLNQQNLVGDIENILMETGQTLDSAKSLPGYGVPGTLGAKAAGLVGAGTKGVRMRGLVEGLSAIARNRLFGASLTGNEQSSAREFLADPWSESKTLNFIRVVKRRLPTAIELQRKNFNIQE